MEGGEGKGRPGKEEEAEEEKEEEEKEEEEEEEQEGGEEEENETKKKEEETAGARRRREKQLRGVIGEWRRIHVRGAAAAPAAAGTAAAGRKKKTKNTSVAQQQQQQQQHQHQHQQQQEQEETLLLWHVRRGGSSSKEEEEEEEENADEDQMKNKKKKLKKETKDNLLYTKKEKEEENLEEEEEEEEDKKRGGQGKVKEEEGEEGGLSAATSNDDGFSSSSSSSSSSASSSSVPVVSAPLGGLVCGVSIIHDSTIRCLNWHHKGGYLVAVCPGSASPSQQCSVHSLKKKQTIHPLRKAAAGPMQAAAFHPTRPCLVLAYPHIIRIVNLQRRGTATTDDTEDEIINRKLMGADNVCCLDIHPKGMQIVAGGGDRNVYVFDLDLSPRVYKTLRSHRGAVISTSIHPRYPLLFTASHDGTVQVYHFKVYDDLVTNPLIIPVRKLRPPGEGKMKVTACAWHPTQPWLVVGDSRGQCTLWR